MVEDPWYQLMERKSAIDKSEINISQGNSLSASKSSGDDGRKIPDKK